VSAAQARRGSQREGLDTDARFWTISRSDARQESPEGIHGCDFARLRQSRSSASLREPDARLGGELAVGCCSTKRPYASWVSAASADASLLSRLHPAARVARNRDQGNSSGMECDHHRHPQATSLRIMTPPHPGSTG